MVSRLNPYISFKGDARQAMQFYKTVFGGKLDLSTFKDFHSSKDPSDDDKIMHSQLETDNGIFLMGADTPKGMDYDPGSRISVSLSGDEDAELSGYFDKLSAGGKVSQALVAAPWGDKFGMLTDKFGIVWLVNISAKKS